MQKNATPTKEQAETICKAGLNPGCWSVVQEYKYIMVIINRETKEVRRIGK